MRAEYTARVNRVIDYIEHHLEQPLSVAELAAVAHFSKYHFHRIFRAMTGEPLSRFVQRLRVERAAVQLLANPKTPITEIALSCGFTSSTSFARVFRETFAMSASAWRDGGHSKIRQQDRNRRHVIRNRRNDFHIRVCYFDPDTQTPTWSYTMNTNDSPLRTEIEVKELPQLHVAYVRHIGPYAGRSELFQALFQKIMSWAGARGFINADTQLITVAHDDPKVTSEEHLRISVCATVPEGTAADGEVGVMTIPGGTFAVARFEVATDRVAEAWDAIMCDWLPESGYQPDDRYCYEVSRNNPREHPEGKLIMDICVPVRPL